ncbi:MAG: hypothetical protein UY81_C0027G0006 [Candidatus Giovannonibacteria bacterium GW2011_GWA2_53_7]|uniref:Uncharacterized protein n=1 Tax=Candidatus Giovannonibacteria bacterium GW2011_GWA2_53_7 TaxID=1618650 RepID=A0A0G1XZW3_9BACT|nr:MAG: hypothetical protein UY81_C0027G0006 [Candidatus Giovannonibacteria bacterium GW2011_GWA2_53_7]
MGRKENPTLRTKQQKWRMFNRLSTAQRLLFHKKQNRTFPCGLRSGLLTGHPPSPFHFDHLCVSDPGIHLFGRKYFKINDLGKRNIDRETRGKMYLNHATPTGRAGIKELEYAQHGNVHLFSPGDQYLLHLQNETGPLCDQ